MNENIGYELGAEVTWRTEFWASEQGSLQPVCIPETKKAKIVKIDTGSKRYLIETENGERHWVRENRITPVNL